LGARSNWIVVTSAAHVRIGRGQGFMQGNHAKAASQKRITPGSRVAYDSPTMTYGGSDRLQAFTALGVAKAREPFPCDMGGLHSFRREVQWQETIDAPIQPSLERMELSTGARNWARNFATAFFSISEHDMSVIARAI
jgi:hypothetical protein